MHPTPIPQTMRPAKSCATVVAAQKGIAPTVVIATPERTIFRRPSMLPKKKAIKLPMKPPMLYMELTVPRRLGLGLLKVLRNHGLIIKPLKIPLSYPNKRKPIVLAIVIKIFNGVPLTLASGLSFMVDGVNFEDELTRV